MSSYSAISLSRLETAHIDLQVIFKEVIQYFDNSILVGYRDEVAQNLAYKEKLSKLQWPNSPHNANPSMAIDATPYPIDWKDLNRIIYFAGFVKATAQALYNEELITHLVRWGGDWVNDTMLNKAGELNDLDHFELIVPSK